MGSSSDMRKRRNEHLRKITSGRHENPKFQNAWNKYNDFEFEMLTLCKEADLLWQEQLAINAFDAVRVGYNIAPIAGAPMRGRKASLETKAKLSAAGKGRMKTPEHIAKIAGALRGLKRSAMVKAKMSIQRKGNLSDRQLINLDKGRTAHHSVESRIKSSQASKLVWQRPEVIMALKVRTQASFELALAEYLQNPTRCEICNKVVMPLLSQQDKKFVTRLRNRRHCSRACANKVKDAVTLLKKEKAASAAA